MVILTIMAGCSKYQVDDLVSDASLQADSNVVEVVFDQPVDLADLSALISTDIHIVQVRATMVDNYGAKHTYGRSLADDEQISLADIHQDAVELFEHQSQIDQEVAEQAKQQGLDEAYQEAILPNRKIREVTVSYLMLDVTQEQRNRLESSLELLGGETKRWQRQDMLQNLNSKEDDEPLDERAVRVWMPNIGNITSGDRSSTTRYVYQRARWQNRSPFQRWYTYEHDFFLNNYSNNRGTYLSRDQNSQGFPICTWTSNLPAAYLDTRLKDPASEVAYTIGCGDAYRIKTQEWYTSTIYVRKGDVSRDVGKLNAQLGTQIPVGCTSVWCSFAVETQRLVPAWGVNLPGTHYWYY